MSGMLILILGGSPLQAADALDLASLSARAAQSSVHISGYMGEQDGAAFAEASGFFVDESGFILSVLNLFTDRERRRLCERFSVRLADGRELPARAHSADAMLNLISLQVLEPGTYPAVASGSGSVRPGDWVLALAGGETPPSSRYTVGQVKARHKKSVYGAGLGDMFIDSRLQLPAIAYGGPLLNERGEVIGINTPNIHRPDSEVADPQEAHALPIRVVEGFFRVSKNFPSSEQRWMGLAFRPLTPDEKTAAYKLLGRQGGLLVDYVWEEGPASHAGIRAGDLLVSLNGKELTHLHQLERLLHELDAGDRAELALLREGKGMRKSLSLEKRPAWAGYVNWRIPQGKAESAEARQAKHSES